MTTVEEEEWQAHMYFCAACYEFRTYTGGVRVDVDKSETSSVGTGGGERRTTVLAFRRMTPEETAKMMKGDPEKCSWHHWRCFDVFNSIYRDIDEEIAKRGGGKRAT